MKGNDLLLNPSHQFTLCKNSKQGLLMLDEHQHTVIEIRLRPHHQALDLIEKDMPCKPMVFGYNQKSESLKLQISRTNNQEYNQQKQEENELYTVEIANLAKQRGHQDSQGFAKYCSAKYRYNLKDQYQLFTSSIVAYKEEINCYEETLEVSHGRVLGIVPAQKTKASAIKKPFM